MASGDVQASLSPSRKRKLNDVDGLDDLTIQANPSPRAMSLLTPPKSYSTHSSPSKPTTDDNRATSPTSSSLTSISGDQLDGAPTTNATPGAVPQKRRKLTPAEKLQKQQEKESKVKERMEAKAKREEEKRADDEEKQRKRAEREEKKRQKEFEEQQKKQQKDLVKQKEEEEKLKKERSQMRLNAFFVKPKASPLAAPQSVETHEEVESETSPTKPKAIPTDVVEATVASLQLPAKPTLSDYEKRFLPFFVPANAVLAPLNRYRDASVQLDVLASDVEQSLENALTTSHPQANLLRAIKDNANVGINSVPTHAKVQDLVARLQGNSIKPIDLTEDSSERLARAPLQVLKAIPLKYIHFEQDVRPAYYGTYTRTVEASTAKQLARNAWSRALPNTDYDYDSEVEWEEPEEGEDILSDGEDDGDSLEGDDDMEGFLDDENDSPKKKRQIATIELEPDSSGLCWEDDQRQLRRVDDQEACPPFHGLRMGILLDKPPATIDPFSTIYWEKDTKATLPSGTVTGATPTTCSNGSSGMQPPVRVPLQPRPNGGNSKIMEDFTGKTAAMDAAQSTPAPIPIQLPAKRGPKPKNDGSTKVKRMVPAEQMDEFRDAVKGSDLTKIALVEDLKKKFPKLPKDAINNTLSIVAARVGAKEVDKRWVLL